MRLTFVGLDDAFCEAVKSLLGDNYTYRTCQVEEISPRPDLAFVSPSNSLLFMDGGIDYVYSRTMFKDVEAKARKMVAGLKQHTCLGRSYLGIGSAMVVPVDAGGFVVCAPTMFLPQNIEDTNNVYHAMKAVMIVLDGFNRAYDNCIRELVVPAMGCGVGGLSYAKAASQIHKAISDFQTNKCDAPISFHNVPALYIGPSRDQEQPPYYQNTEIRKVAIKEMRHV